MRFIPFSKLNNDGVSQMIIGSKTDSVGKIANSFKMV